MQYYIGSAKFIGLELNIIQYWLSEYRQNVISVQHYMFYNHILRMHSMTRL